jgi:hypothetical protein
MDTDNRKKKKKKDDFIDDGRVIANMNVDGMPRSLIRRTAFDEFGKVPEEKEQSRLTKEERRRVIFGVILSHILFIVMVFGGLALFILFCIKVWFK